jgi:hypothetical protein
MSAYVSYVSSPKNGANEMASSEKKETGEIDENCLHPLGEHHFPNVAMAPCCGPRHWPIQLQPLAPPSDLMEVPQSQTA